MYDVDAVNVSEASLSLAELDDGELLALTRSGHQEAYAALFQRYSYAALRLARHLGQKEESDDVVSESFAQVLSLLNRGKGPNEAFRAYLFTTVRHECARRAKARQRVMPTDDLQKIDSPVEFGDGRLDDFERSAVRAAYESLPPRWRTVLWHLDVEGRKPHELGPLLELSPNSVSALVYRARSGLREAYLQQHVKDDDQTGSRACLEHRPKLSSFVRRTASARDQEKILGHLQSCEACMAIYLDLKDVNREVGSVSASAAAAVAVSATGLAAVATFGGGLVAALTNVAVVTKGLAMALVPTAAAAAITTATLVGPTGQTSIAEPPRATVAATSTPVAQDRAGAPTTDPASTLPAPPPLAVQPPRPGAPVPAPPARSQVSDAPLAPPPPRRAPAPAPAPPKPAPAPAPVKRAPAPAALPTPAPAPPPVVIDPLRAAGTAVLDVVDDAARDLRLLP